MNLADKHKFRITLKSFQTEALNVACEVIQNSLKEANCDIVGPTRIPTKTKRFCVLRSPHVDKDSREHFEIKTSKRFFDIYTRSGFTLDSLMRISLPAGISISITRY